MNTSPYKIFPGLGFLFIVSVVIYFLLINFPGMYNIAAPFSKGEFVTEIGSGSPHFFDKETSGTKTDITEKTIIVSFLIYLFAGVIILRLLAYLIRTIIENKNRTSDFNGTTQTQNYQLIPDRKQQEIHQNQYTQSPEILENDIIAELKAGRKINAVKICKNATGLGLKESLEKVEEIGRQNGIK